MNQELFQQQVILVLARLGRMTSEQIFNFITKERVSIQTCRAWLKVCEAQGLIRSQFLYESRRSPGGIRYGHRVGRFYILTKRGEKYVQAYYPYLPLDLEKRVVEGRDNIVFHGIHQLRFVNLMHDILNHAITVPGYVGCSCIPELQLGPTETPRCDGFLVVRRWNDATQQPSLNTSHGIPWLVEPRIEGHQTDLPFAIEIDNDTEHGDVIQKKARDYGRVFRERWWVGKYKFPMPLFVVPDAQRQQEVVRVWRRGWPEGFIMCTTLPKLQQQGLTQPIWVTEWFDHTSQQVKSMHTTIFQEWQRPVLQATQRDQ